MRILVFNIPTWDPGWSKESRFRGHHWEEPPPLYRESWWRRSHSSLWSSSFNGYGFDY